MRAEKVPGLPALRPKRVALIKISGGGIFFFPSPSLCFVGSVVLSRVGAMIILIIVATVSRRTRREQRGREQWIALCGRAPGRDSRHRNGDIMMEGGARHRLISTRAGGKEKKKKEK